MFAESQKALEDEKRQRTMLTEEATDEAVSLTDDVGALKKQVAYLEDRLKDATTRARLNRVALYHADTTLLAIGAVLATAVDDLMNLPGAFIEGEDADREDFVSAEEHIQAARGLAREERAVIKELRDGVTLNIITGEESEDAG